MRATYDDKYMRNQCSFVIRIDGKEIEVPICFGMTADEIRAIYPFILPLAQTKIQNPSVKFMNESKAGVYADLSDEEFQKKLLECREQTKFWYDKPEASLLELALRFAVNIQADGIADLMALFDTNEHTPSTEVSALSNEAVNDLYQRLNKPMHDADGVASASNQDEASITLYSNTSDDHITKRLEEIESKLSREDAFDDTIRNHLAHMADSEESDEDSDDETSEAGAADSSADDSSDMDYEDLDGSESDYEEEGPPEEDLDFLSSDDDSE